jgi:hypothetical protein
VAGGTGRRGSVGRRFGCSSAGGEPVSPGASVLVSYSSLVIASGSSGGYRRPSMEPVQTLRRALLALGLAVTTALIVRMRGSGGTPPRRGGWRELSVTDLDE